MTPRRIYWAGSYSTADTKPHSWSQARDRLMSQPKSWSCATQSWIPRVFRTSRSKSWAYAGKAAYFWSGLYAPTLAPSATLPAATMPESTT